ncbi:FecCD family ABC transporter permease [Effusibacillus lacus]|uniref:Iron ABC transporter permease n=1 Tax=Effusibacillus lacus TaxID=1348429 RepID=A0A292YM48_9BACL|nr:iron ABC transporter permease [Effusibacillus lacus]TCS71449.1 iron complex transport system permease protein [Effusibacillus lacus]GAX89979.1 iron ABC transporter permease [Effusibacillus lacus]
MKKYVPFRMNKPPVSFLLDKKTAVITITLLILTMISLVVSTGLGSMKIHPLEVIKVLVGSGAEQYTVVVQSFRLPRNVIAILVGAALAVAGAILQGVFRNPLASPDIIGITGGASVAAIIFITQFEKASIHLLPVAAFLGAATVAVLIYILAWKRGVTPLRLVLIGVGMDFAMHGLTTLFLVISHIHLTSKAKIWLTGTLYGTTWNNVSIMLLWMLVLIPLTFVFGRNVNVQQLGDEIATGVGSELQRHRVILLTISVALAGSAIAFGGNIAFVGLLAPHIARKLVGSAFGGLLPVSALIGALMVMLADLVARTAFAPMDVPVGIFTSAIGAPFFIYLLYKNQNR